MKKLLALVVASMILAACKTTTPTTTGAKAPASPQDNQTAGGVSGGKTDSAPLNSVYFDLDKSDVQSRFKDDVKRQAEWLEAHKKDVVTLEGNTDERGSNEYNIALGNRRAKAVHRMLVAMGIPGERIKDTSFGKEKPKATCHDESCWQQNRRVDFAHSQE